MENYLKLFKDTEEYNNYDTELPQIGHLVDEIEEKKSPYIIADLNVRTTESATVFCNSTAVSSLTNVYIDGDKMTPVGSAHTFNTLGKHTVKLELADQSGIGVNFFFACTAITSIVIPEGVTYLDRSSFYYMTNLKSISLPNSLRSISKQTFSSCSGLTSIVLSENTSFLGVYAFENCYSLKSIIIKATTPPDLPSGMYERNTVFYGSHCPIYVPAESVNLYKTGYWSGYSSRIQPIQ